MIERRAAAAVTALIAALALAACGDLENGGGDGDTSRGELTQGSTTTADKPEKDLPPRPSGVVESSGDTDSELIAQVDQDFASYASRSGVAVRIEPRAQPLDQSFKDLCDGNVDITVSARRITDAELAACEDNGLKVVDFQVAYDAIVVATQNEADVGADCVNLAQLRAMYGAGSPVNAWNQLNPNFSVLRIRPAGPEAGTADFNYFGSRVLGVPEPTLANFRSDYRPFAEDVQTKNFVSGRADAAAYKQAGRAARKLDKNLRKARHNLKERARELKIASKELNVSGRLLDKTVKQQDRKAQAQAEARHDEAEKQHSIAERAYADAEKRFKRAEAKANKNNRRLNRSGKSVPPGAVGIFPFSFYELWEEKLRPLEIDGQTGDRCVFPSEETISSELYPLESTLRLYTTTRSLRRPEVQAYIQRTLEQAEDIANQLELIPISDQLRDDQITKIRNPTETEADSGSSSQGPMNPAGSDTTSTEATTTDETTSSEGGTTTTEEQSQTTDSETTTSEGG